MERYDLAIEGLVTLLGEGTSQNLSILYTPTNTPPNFLIYSGFCQAALLPFNPITDFSKALTVRLAT